MLNPRESGEMTAKFSGDWKNFQASSIDIGRR